MKTKLLSAMIAATISAATMSNAMAADTGTVSFSGSATSGSCVVTGLNQSVNIPEMTVEEVIATTTGAAVKFEPYEFSVSGCPATTTIGEVTYTFTPHSGADKDYIDLPGADIRGVAVALHDGSSYIKSGQTREFAISSGSGVHAGLVRVNRVTGGPTGSPAGSAEAGSFAGTFDVSMDFR